MLNEIEKYIARETLSLRGTTEATVWFHVIWAGADLTVVWNLLGDYILDVYGSFNYDADALDAVDEATMTNMIRDHITCSSDFKDIF